MEPVAVQDAGKGIAYRKAAVQVNWDPVDNGAGQRTGDRRARLAPAPGRKSANWLWVFKITDYAEELL